MKKKALFVSLAALAAVALGCSEDKDDPINCVHGFLNGDVCECLENYTTDESGRCTKCASGFTEKDNTCVQGSNPPGPVDDSCNTTIIYKNSNYKGKPVYLIGEFNNWQKEDSKYKFTENNGTFTLVIDGKVNTAFAKGQSAKFKVYVGGGLSDSEAYRSVAAVCTDGDDHNCLLNVSCGQTFSMNEDTGTGNIHTEPTGDCLTTFRFYNAYTDVASGGVQAFKVHLVGDFNNWEKNDPNYTMTSDGNGCHTIQVKFDKDSTTKYKFHIEGWDQNPEQRDDGWQPDPYNTNYDNDNNSTAYIGSCGLTFGGCPGSSSGGTQISNTMPTSANSELEGIDVNGMNITIRFKDTPTEIVDGGVNPRIEGKTVVDQVTEKTKYTYRVKVGDGEAYVPVWVEDQKWDWHNALLYFAFTDRFVNGKQENDRKSNTWKHCPASDWYGGDFVGMKQKVEEGYFDKLGVNTLWISSVTKNTDATSEGTNGDDHNYAAYHSYWPVSAFRTDENAADFNGLPAIEDHFGTLEELQDLVDTCHRHGIRVLVDFAANHVFKDSPIIEKHRDWFNDLDNKQLCDNNNNWDNYSEKCWFSQDLPDINYENPNARKAMVDHAIWLIKKTNIDGFRVDAVKHMNIQFIRDLRAAVDKLYANTDNMFYMVGETFTSDQNLLNNYIGDDLLHAQFDFPLYYSIGNVLRGNGLWDLAKNYNAWFKSDLMGTFMGNHDVARALSVAAGHNESKWGNNETPNPDWWQPYFRVKTAWTYLLTRPGVPLIYYGDEAGMPGANDPDNRRMMIFGDSLNREQKSMLEFVQKLGQIRKEHPATRFGTRTDLHVDNENWCYLMEKDNDRILVAIATEKGSGCDLHGTYRLQNLLEPTQPEFDATGIDMNTNRLNVFLVK